MTYFLDLDGTLVYHGTNTPLPGAVEWLKNKAGKGCAFVICTRRGKEFEGHPIYGECQKAIDALGITPLAVVTDCNSPRTIVNDEPCFAINRETNADWPHGEKE